MILKSIEIEKFRNLPSGEYPLGKRITVITGQNATGKSTLLGMIGQGFGLIEKDIWGMQFTSKFSSKFKLSTQYDTTDYKYYLNTYQELHPEGKKVPVISYKRSNTDSIRLVVGANREAGHGNIDIPVIFLSLKRVSPLGETTAPTLKPDEFTDDERVFFTERHRKILQETVEITPQRFQSKAEKRTIGVQTPNYDSMSISAGQDNIGQILGAIISIRRLKQKLTSQYKGAFLLIDEVDVTLHAASQRALMEVLYQEAQKNSIQIVVTTHSWEVINWVLVQQKITRSTNYSIWHLSVPFGEIVLQYNPDGEVIRRNLYLDTDSNLNDIVAVHKINIYLEDCEAELFLKKICTYSVA